MLFSCPPAQVLRQSSTVEPIGLNPLSWSSGNHRRSGDQARVGLCHQAIIQSVARGSRPLTDPLLRWCNFWRRLRRHARVRIKNYSARKTNHRFSRRSFVNLRIFVTNLRNADSSDESKACSDNLVGNRAAHYCRLRPLSETRPCKMYFSRSRDAHLLSFHFLIAAVPVYNSEHVVGALCARIAEKQPITSRLRPGN